MSISFFREEIIKPVALNQMKVFKTDLLVSTSIFKNIFLSRFCLEQSVVIIAAHSTCLMSPSLQKLASFRTNVNHTRITKAATVLATIDNLWANLFLQSIAYNKNKYIL